MQRYFIGVPYNGQDTVLIKGEDVHHITRVMRMEPGDMLWIVFSDKKAARAQIEAVNEDVVEAAVVDWEETAKELPVEVTIAGGLPKGDKWEWVIQKGTELGAVKIVPFIADRSIVKWEDKKAEKKLARWRKIAKEAAEQSHRQAIPEVIAPIGFRELLQLAGHYEHKIAAYEESAKSGEGAKLSAALAAARPGERILIVFGPEGGLSGKEAQQLFEDGFCLAGLGPRILRTETAPLYALAAVSYHFELMR